MLLTDSGNVIKWTRERKRERGENRKKENNILNK